MSVSFNNKIRNNCIDNLSLKIQPLYKLLKCSFGPYGKSVLFERSGKVFTTKDGSEILSVISVEDPVALLLINDVTSFGKHYGDGVKLFVIFISELLSSLGDATSYCFVNDHQRRSKMIECLVKIKNNILPLLYDQLFHKLDSFFVVDESTSRINRAIFSFITTKFPSSISHVLADLLISFIFQEKSVNYLSILKNAVINPGNYFIEIPGLSIHQSKIVQGFILTRNFKNLFSLDLLLSSLFILWSIELDENKDSQTSDALEIDSGSSLADFFCYKHKILSSYLKMLKEKKISLILSSTHFPEWAIAICMHKGISVIDMIDKEEFDIIKIHLGINEVSSFCEIPTYNNIGSSSFTKFRIGDKKYVKMQLVLKQVILCAPTLSQTKQYSDACHKALKYLYHWLKDSNNEISIAKTDITNFPEHPRSPPVLFPMKLYYVPSKGYVYFLLTKCLEETKYSKDCGIEKNVMREMLTIPLKMLHKQRNNRSDGTFLQHLTTMELNIDSASVPSSAELIENPFMALKILSQVASSLAHLLKIENVIYTSVRLKNLCFHNSDFSDNEDEMGSDIKVHL